MTKFYDQDGNAVEHMDESADGIFAEIADRLTKLSDLPPRAEGDDWAPDIREKAVNMINHLDGTKAAYERAAPDDAVMQALLKDHYEAMPGS